MEQSTPEAVPYGASIQVAPVIQEECTSPPVSEQLAIGNRFLVKNGSS